MCCRSLPDRAVNGLSKHPLRRGRSSTACQVPACWRMCWSRKFGDPLPLYRQSDIYARGGVDLGRPTLAGWVGAASELLATLVDEIRRHVLAGSKIYADYTPVPVLAPGNGNTRTARLWTYVRDDRPAGYRTAPAVWFAYSQDRKGEQSNRATAALEYHRLTPGRFLQRRLATLNRCPLKIGGNFPSSSKTLRLDREGELRTLTPLHFQDNHQKYRLRLNRMSNEHTLMRTTPQSE